MLSKLTQKELLDKDLENIITQGRWQQDTIWTFNKEQFI